MGRKKQAPPKERGAGRTRVFATLVYKDSALPDWKENLVQEHVPALISPYHDKDVNPDGTPKKPHWHLMVLFDGVKTEEQVNELLDRVVGPKRLKVFENVQSTRGYARYLCHLDNPEKAQYDRAEVREFSGAKYDEIVALPSDDFEVLEAIFDYIDETGERYYGRFMKYCRRERRDWWKLLMQRYSYTVIQYMKSEAKREADEQEGVFRTSMKRRGGPALKINPATGEVVGTEDQDDDCQD